MCINKIFLRSLILLLPLIQVCVWAQARAEGLDSVAGAREILTQIDDLWRADSSKGQVMMRVKTAHYTRTVEMEEWSKGKERSLVRILSPRKEKGTATLKVDKAIYTYLPKTDRTIRLTSSMMMGSWMGSHFTNDDLVKESRLADDYEPDIIFEGERDGQQVIDFALTPKLEAPVVWGKIVFTVRAGDYLPLVSTYYDDDMILARTIAFSEIKKLGGRKLPTVLTVTPADKADEYTELIYQKLDFGIDIDEAFFSLNQLRRR